MTLQQLLGELQTLALAYPDETPVQARLHDVCAEVTGVAVDSDESGVAVLLEVAA